MVLRPPHHVSQAAPPAAPRLHPVAQAAASAAARTYTAPGTGRGCGRAGRKRPPSGTRPCRVSLSCVRVDHAPPPSPPLLPSLQPQRTHESPHASWARRRRLSSHAVHAPCRRTGPSLAHLMLHCRGVASLPKKTATCVQFSATCSGIAVSARTPASLFPPVKGQAPTVAKALNELVQLFILRGRPRHSFLGVLEPRVLAVALPRRAAGPHPRGHRLPVSTLSVGAGRARGRGERGQGERGWSVRGGGCGRTWCLAATAHSLSLSTFVHRARVTCGDSRFTQRRRHSSADRVGTKRLATWSQSTSSAALSSTCYLAPPGRGVRATPPHPRRPHAVQRPVPRERPGWRWTKRAGCPRPALAQTEGTWPSPGECQQAWRPRPRPGHHRL